MQYVCGFDVCGFEGREDEVDQLIEALTGITEAFKLPP